MRRKKLIIFSYDFPPSTGGIARLCIEIAVRSNKYYSEIIVLTRKKLQTHIPYNKEVIEVVELPSKRVKCEIAAIRFLWKLKEKKNIDILCGVWHPEALLSILSGLNNIYILGHGAEFLSRKSKLRKYLWLRVYAKYVLEKVSTIIANSKYTASIVQKITQNADIRVLPLAVNELFFSPILSAKKDKNRLSLCSVSRIQQFKGHDFIIKTIAQLPIEYRFKIYYKIAGTGPYLSNLKQLVDELSLNDIVKFAGYVPDAELPDFYNSSDLFILCTRESKESIHIEGFGLVFLEAQACGIPVIGTNTGGISDAIEEDYGGWLIEQDNQQQLSKLLIKLINKKDILIENGINARSRIEQKYTWSIYCEKLFKEIIK